MPNHFHLMVMTNDKSCSERSAFGGKAMQTLPYSIGVLLSSYSQLMNKQNGTVGSLFQQKTKSKLIPDYNNIIRCMHYIHQNPFRAGLLKKNMEIWKHSSYVEYSDNISDGLSNIHLLFELTGYKRSDFMPDSFNLIEDNELFYI